MMKAAVNLKMLTALGMLCLGALRVWGETEQPVLPLVLEVEQACRLVLEYNPQLCAARQQLNIQDGVLRQAGASGRPHLAATGNYTGFDENRLQNFGGLNVENTRWNASLDASLTVFSGWRNRYVIKGEEARKEAIALGIDAAEQDLRIAARQAFCDAVLAQDRVEVQQEVIAVVSQQLAIARSRLAAGVGDPFDATQAEVALASAGPPLIRARNDLLRGIELLRSIIGVPYPDGTDAADVELGALPEPPRLELRLEEALGTARLERAELRQLDYELEAAQQALKLAQWGKSPTVDVFAGYGIEGDQFGAGDNLEGWVAGARLSWPLIDGGARGGQVQQACARLLQVEYERAALLLQIEGEVRRTYYDWEEAATILQTSQQVIEQAREALRLARNRYDAGRGTQLDVLESQLQLTRSRLEHSSAQRDLALAAAHIRRAIGAGGE